MNRPAALTLLLCASAAAWATPAPPRDLPEPPAKAAPMPDGGLKLVLTAASVVILDGRAVEIGDAPGDAEVVTLEVAHDQKTILKIAFRSRKP